MCRVDEYLIGEWRLGREHPRAVDDEAVIFATGHVHGEFAIDAFDG